MKSFCFQKFRTCIFLLIQNIAQVLKVSINDIHIIHMSLLSEHLNITSTLELLYKRALYQLRILRISNLLWIVMQCGSGFVVPLLNESYVQQGELYGVMRVECPHCKYAMCSSCQLQWHAEHEHMSCKDFKLFLQKPNEPLADHSPLVRAALEISVHFDHMTMLIACYSISVSCTRISYFQNVPMPNAAGCSFWSAAVVCTWPAYIVIMNFVWDAAASVFTRCDWFYSRTILLYCHMHWKINFYKIDRAL